MKGRKTKRLSTSLRCVIRRMQELQGVSIADNRITQCMGLIGGAEQANRRAGRASSLTT